MNDLQHIFFSGADTAALASAGRAIESARALPKPLRPTISRRPEELSEPDPLVIWLLEQARVDVHAYRAQPLVRRLPACLRQLRTSCPVRARSLLERRAELVPAAIDSLLIGVSEFFRDAPVFAHVENVVLPELLAQRRRPLRICSVGSSGGQELYSVAMLLAEAGALEGTDLLGVDCRPEAITRARRGHYESIAGLPEAYREAYFSPQDDGWTINERLRRQTRWETSDLFAWADATTWDLILFRNVAIYLKDAPAAEAWTRLVARLAPGGGFITGKAEVPPRHLPLTRSAHSVYRKF